MGKQCRFVQFVAKLLLIKNILKKFTESSWALKFNKNIDNIWIKVANWPKHFSSSLSQDPVKRTLKNKKDTIRRMVEEIRRKEIAIHLWKTENGQDTWLIRIGRESDRGGLQI
jgi:hypothetical protein